MDIIWFYAYSESLVYLPDVEVNISRSYVSRGGILYSRFSCQLRVTRKYLIKNPMQMQMIHMTFCLDY